MKHPNRGLHNWLVYAEFDRIFKKIEKYIKGTIVDLGCGESPFKQTLLQFGEKYIGVDWSNSHHKVQLDVIADLNRQLPFKTEEADTLIAFSVLEHLHDPLLFLQEAKRIIKCNGYFVLVVPWQWGLHEEPCDFYRYTPYGLSRLCKASSFKLVSIEAIGGGFSMLALKLNYLTRRSIRGPRIIRIAMKACLIPLWTFGQLVAPIFDRLDRNKLKEARSYLVVLQG